MLDPVALQLGPFTIYWYGIIITFAFILGTLLAYYHTTKTDIDPEHILNLLILIIPASIIGARLFQVFSLWDDYKANPIEILATWHGGLAIHGGLIGGFLVGYYYVRKYRLDFWRLADIFAPSIILGQAIGRWGNFINQEAYGSAVTSSYISHFPDFIQRQMLIGGQYYHPAFLYESVWNLLVFIILIISLRRQHLKGQIMLLYLVLYSVGRFFIESIRLDSLMWGPFRSAQFLSVMIIITCAVIYLRRLKKGNIP
ncbi:MAG: prolipoprotein diacylglyceryl transferase [Desulfotomaculaceae bacterium]|nr:prolipoprotein diacylglyceryl transferase [Desulfotomaculaceae bacterium]